MKLALLLPSLATNQPYSNRIISAQLACQHFRSATSRLSNNDELFAFSKICILYDLVAYSHTGF